MLKRLWPLLLLLHPSPLLLLCLSPLLLLVLPQWPWWQGQLLRLPLLSLLRCRQMLLLLLLWQQLLSWPLLLRLLRRRQLCLLRLLLLLLGNICCAKLCHALGPCKGVPSGCSQSTMLLLLLLLSCST